jgi:hypothetical protein
MLPGDPPNFIKLSLVSVIMKGPTPESANGLKQLTDHFLLLNKYGRKYDIDISTFRVPSSYLKSNKFEVTGLVTLQILPKYIIDIEIKN